MSLCQSIDTLSMAFLDDELAAEERRELELHLLDCAGCRHHLDGQRDELSMLRKALVAPPAPDLLKARIAKMLDAEDATDAKQARQRWTRWLLPGSSIAAAAAAILVFVGLGVGTGGAPRESPVALDVARTHSLPLEVQGASTGPWLRDHFAPVEPPRFTEPGIALLGARLLPNGVYNHDAAMLSYLVTLGQNRLSLTAVVLKDLDDDLLNRGDEVQVGGLTLHLHDANGMPLVSYVDRVHRVGYVFASERLTRDELIRLVVSTDLIARAQQSR